MLHLPNGLEKGKKEKKEIEREMKVDPVGQHFKEKIKYLTENLYLVTYILANPQHKLIS